jgi:hypothetical protein
MEPNVYWAVACFGRMENDGWEEGHNGGIYHEGARDCMWGRCATAECNFSVSDVYVASAECQRVTCGGIMTPATWDTAAASTMVWPQTACGTSTQKQ